MVGGEVDCQMEHLPEKVIEDLSDISRWLINHGSTNDFLKTYITQRSSMLVKSLNGSVLCTSEVYNYRSLYCVQVEFRIIEVYIVYLEGDNISLSLQKII